MTIAEPTTVISLTIPGRPYTVNAERRMSPFKRASVTKEWRTAAWALALEQKLPRIPHPVSITVTPISRARAGKQDVAAVLPAAKAAIDGLTDAHVLPADTPDIVTSLTFLAPERGDHDAIRLLIGPAA